ncbi:MAG: DUF2207 domain-containing protein [Phycisphaerae bacterium]|nr:DUF2207 domain-containing protein [Phycisphaerae bacterium]
MRREWISLAAVAMLCWIFGSYQVRSQTYTAGASRPSTKPAPPAGPERILRFHSEITVHDDSSLTVTESARVVVLGKAIRRGICWDFPMRYGEQGDSRLVVPLEVAAVLKNGEPEPYNIVDMGRYKRMYVGEKDVFLKPGVYTYTLVYRTDGQLLRREGNYELRRDVIGNNWTFEIAQASVRVRLPKGVADGKVRHIAHTGPEGAKGRVWKGKIDQGGSVCFTTTSKLGKGEGLTISVTWPDGSTTQPGKE